MIRQHVFQEGSEDLQREFRLEQNTSIGINIFFSQGKIRASWSTLFNDLHVLDDLVFIILTDKWLGHKVKDLLDSFHDLVLSRQKIVVLMDSIIIIIFSRGFIIQGNLIQQTAEQLF